MAIIRQAALKRLPPLSTPQSLEQQKDRIFITTPMKAQDWASLRRGTLLSTVIRRFPGNQPIRGYGTPVAVWQPPTEQDPRTLVYPFVPSHIQPPPGRRVVPVELGINHLHPAASQTVERNAKKCLYSVTDLDITKVLEIPKDTTSKLLLIDPVSHSPGIPALSLECLRWIEKNRPFDPVERRTVGQLSQQARRRLQGPFFNLVHRIQAAMDERGQKSKQITKPPQGEIARKPLPRFFIFKGSPRPQAATPQRIAAQQIANLFKKAGMLPTNEVVEFNLADLPSPPTKAVMKAKATEARGKLLFIRDPGLLRPTAGDAKSFSQTSSLLSRSKHALLALVKAAISTQHPIVVVVSGTPLGMEEMVTRNQALFDAKHWGWDQVAWSFPEERKVPKSIISGDPDEVDVSEDSPVRAEGETGSDNISEFGNQPHNPPTFENQPGESPESGSEPQQLTSQPQPQPQPDTAETATESSEVQIKP